MSDLTLVEASEKSGLPLAVIRKDVTRKKLKAHKVDGKVVTTDEYLALYMGARGLVKIASALEKTNGTTKPLTATIREVGNLFGNLSPQIRSAILDGIPRTTNGKVSGGNADAYRKATKGHKVPKVTLEHEDPHWGHPVGYQHEQSPRWKRISESTWELDGATWSFNGMFWEGGGVREGKVVDLPISPAHTASDMRPLAPPKPVKT